MPDVEYEERVKNSLNNYLLGNMSILDLNEKLVDPSWDNDHPHQAYALVIRGVIHSSDLDKEQVDDIVKQSLRQIRA